MDTPETLYAVSGGGHIGYQIWGDGDVDLLELSYGTVISIDETNDEPHWSRYIRGLSSFSRLIRYDPRGIGLSDPLAHPVAPTTDETVADAIAVLDAAGSAKAVLIGVAGGSMIAVEIAARHPDRVSALVLINGGARLLWAEDYPLGIPPGLAFGSPGAEHEIDDAMALAPSLAPDPVFRSWWSRGARRGASPATAPLMAEAVFSGDVRHLLGDVAVPVLVMHRRDTAFVTTESSRYLVERLADARYVELEGADFIPYSGPFDQMLSEIREFVTGERSGPNVNRVLTTVLFLDVVDSTATATRLGDYRWRDVLEDLTAMVRRQVELWSGRFVKDTGDGCLATFDSPTNAVECARAAVRNAHQLEVQVRVGVHTGEIERRGEDIGGIGVHIAARIMDCAQADEIVVSSTVVDLVDGAGFTFNDRGTEELRGVPTPKHLFTLR